MATYTDAQREHAVDLAAEHGPTEASKLLDIPRRTISDWMKKAGVEPPQANTEKTTKARAVAAERVATAWADYRENEATAAGATANRIRQEIRKRVDDGADGSDIRHLATAYGILVDKAEKLSDRATQRIEVWSESELDRDLRTLVAEMEDRIRGEEETADDAADA